MATIRVQAQAFDVEEETAALVAGRTDIGAVVSFVGLCRDEGGALDALELEHYPGMAEDEMARVASEAAARWPLLGLTAIHRYGKIAPGAPIVLVIACAAHRRAAFAAAEFMMDFLKTRAPFWKKDHRKDGVAGGWVDAREEDEAARARWEASS
jgi:molybdopterin synthase catalytic subunit